MLRLGLENLLTCFHRILRDYKMHILTDQSSRKRKINLELEIRDMKITQQKQKDTINQLEYKMNKVNLIFYGISEKNNITINQSVESVLYKNLKLRSNVHVVQAFRVGGADKANASLKPRPIKVVFANISDRDIVWKEKKCLKGSGIYIDEDLPFEYRLKRREFYPIVKAARSNPSVKKVFMVQNKIVINENRVGFLPAETYFCRQNGRNWQKMVFNGKNRQKL